MASCGHNLSTAAAQLQSDLLLSEEYKAVPRTGAMDCFPHSFQIPHPGAISMSLKIMKQVSELTK